MRKSTLRKGNHTSLSEIRKSQGAFFLLTVFICFNLILTGCTRKASSSDAFSQFNLIDSFIRTGQYTDAMKELKKLSKKVYDSWSTIGIYKRYALLGEKELSEKSLKKGLKQNPKNPELSAVYAKFLLTQNRASEAEKISEVLQKTRYASIYAESVFKNHLTEISEAKPSLLYEDQKYFDLYFDAYQSSRNPVWLRNCAAGFLSNGKYDRASELSPVAYNDSRDAYFWALVSFDAGDYLKCINACESASYFLESLGNKKGTAGVSEITLAALESDSYSAVSDMANAHMVREEILARYVTGFDLNRELSSEEKRLLPIIAVNSAAEEKLRQNDQASVDLLSFCVMNYPEYVPALVAYSNFAYESNLARREDDEITALRKAGLQTLEMERYDSRAKIPLSDALARLDNAITYVKDPKLYITRLDLRYKSNRKLTTRDKTADLWRLLEESSTDEVRYHDMLVQYTVNFLLENDMTSDAFSILKKYMSAKYEKKSADFYENAALLCRSMDVADLEMVSWFALTEKRVEEAQRILEYIVFESAGDRGNDISPKASGKTALNLGTLYYGMGLKDKALDLYGKIAGRETDKKLKSTAFYRIACIYYAFGDNQSALRSADYACSIDPENAEAHLLKTKLTVK